MQLIQKSKDKCLDYAILWANNRAMITIGVLNEKLGFDGDGFGRRSVGLIWGLSLWGEVMMVERRWNGGRRKGQITGTQMSEEMRYFALGYIKQFLKLLDCTE